MNKVIVLKLFVLLSLRTFVHAAEVTHATGEGSLLDYPPGQINHGKKFVSAESGTLTVSVPETPYTWRGTLGMSITQACHTLFPLSVEIP